MSHKIAKRERAYREEQRDTLLATAAAKVEPFIGALIEAFQTRFRQRARGFYEEFPEAYRPCSTCAMNRSTNDWPGADRTALNLVTALMLHVPFYCHDGAPEDGNGWLVDPDDPETRVCAGMVALDGDEEMAIECAREAYATQGVHFENGKAGDFMIRRFLQEMAATVSQWEAERR